MRRHAQVAVRPASMMFHSARPVLTASLLVAFSATACSSNNTTAAVCPDSAIIHGLDRMFGETASGDEISVTLENIDGLCTYGGTELSMEMSVDLVVNAPPGTQVPYFVVIAGPAGDILDKSSFTAIVPPDSADPSGATAGGVHPADQRGRQRHVLRLRNLFRPRSAARHRYRATAHTLRSSSHR